MYIWKGVMKIFAILGGEKTKPIQSQSKPIRQEEIDGQVLWRPSAGNPKHEALNPNELKECDLKKQSQFAVGRSWGKVLFERNIWQ